MRISLVVALTLAVSGNALAQDKPDASSANDSESSVFAPATCDHPADAQQEAADQQIVSAAMSAENSGGYDALTPHLDALQAVLARAPACYPEFERRGGDIIARSNIDTAATLALLTEAAAQGQSVRLVHGSNTYVLASLLLGSYYDENHNFDQGISWLDRGLALQPHEQYLVLEKATALGQLHRFDEQVAMLQAELDAPEAALTLDRVRFERNLGVALIDANRLDDAKAALQESLRLQPDNPRAQAELDYIAQLRAGRPPTTATMGPLAPNNAPPVTTHK
ncbi:MAG: hypothetical protein ABUL73_02300 [Alphaproteobacteria bacterium]